MRCPRKCGGETRPFYDEAGYVVVGQECRRCGASVLTWDAGITPPTIGPVRRYAPAALPDAGESTELAPAPTIFHRLCAWAPCGRPFVPTHGNEKYDTESCRLFAKNAQRVARLKPEPGCVSRIDPAAHPVTVTTQSPPCVHLSRLASGVRA